MILQALKEYYDRKAADPDSGIAPLGWERKGIPFLVNLDSAGNFIGFRDTRERKGKTIQAKTFLVPSLGEGKGSKIKANLLWENGEYFFGIPMDIEKFEGKRDSYLGKVSKRHTAFVAKIHELVNGADVKILQPILVFLKDLRPEFITENEIWQEIQKHASPLFLFAINGTPVTDIPEIRNLINSSGQARQVTEDRCICLVTGTQDVIAELEPPISGVSDKGAHIASFNKPAFESYGKKKGANSPIGKNASSAYTTALNSLLAAEIQVGDAKMVFWSDRANPLEDHFAAFFSEPKNDNPDDLTDHVKALYKSVHTGALVSEDAENRFFVLGLSPNSARISIRFWHQGTVREMSERFCQYFEDLRICHRESEKEDLSLRQLLISTAPRGDADKISPLLAGNLMRSILEGLPFPEILLTSILSRLKADNVPNMLYPRVKLIKGYLNRKLRFNNPNNERSLTVSLDKENKNIGYLLGRLFAVLERIQQDASPGINTTIRDKFYSSASSMPSAVFGNLMRLHVHHLAKLEDGKRIFYEQILSEIISHFNSFPANLTLSEQAFFAIGYYHQTRDFFTSKKDKNLAV